MRNVKIAGVVYKAYNKDDIPYESCECVQELHDRHLYKAMELHKHVRHLEKGINEEKVIQMAYTALFKDPEKLAHYVRMQKLDEQLLTASLVFNIDYDELGALPRKTVLTLIAEAKKEVGSITDFLDGLGISTESNLSETTQTLTNTSPV